MEQSQSSRNQATIFSIIQSQSNFTSLILPEWRAEETKCRTGNGGEVKTPHLHPKGVQSSLPKSPGRPLHRRFPRCVYKRAKPAPLSLTHSSYRSMDGERIASLFPSLYCLWKKVESVVGLSDGVYKMRRLSFPNPLIWIFSDPVVSGPPPSARLLILILLLLFSAIFIS